MKETLRIIPLQEAKNKETAEFLCKQILKERFKTKGI
jgi:hypothetical protein